jgi:hypothetical protein
MKSFNPRAQNPLGVLEPCDSVNNYALVANTAKNVTSIPVGATHVICSSLAGGVYFKFGDSAMADVTVPAADITDGSGGMLDPVIMHLSGVQKISMICAAASVVTLSFFAGE